jgi:DNA-binding transcriptional regulator PaaX
MVLTFRDLELLKQLRAAGGRGRDVRELNIRIALNRLVKGGYLVGRPIGRDSVQYRITQRGQDAIEPPRKVERDEAEGATPGSSA